MIETKEAGLKTAVVTIQCLTVSGKQMTLAVFRQLPAGRVIDDDDRIIERNWWGMVRYRIDDHPLWAVFDLDGKLWRGRIPDSAASTTREPYSVVAFQTALADVARAKERLEQDQQNYRRYELDNCERRLAEASDKYRREVEEIRGWNERADKRNAVRKRLLQLDQLFIAV